LRGARIRFAEKRAIHRAARAARTDEMTRAIRLIDDIPAVFLTNVLHRVLNDGRTRALEQPRIELDAADRVLNARHLHVQPLHVHVKALEGEEAVRILLDVDLEIAHDLGRDPAGAELQARKGFLVEHEHLRAALHELARGRGARRPAAYDEDVNRL